MISNCPGAKRFREPKPEIINCPFCGQEVEIWSDEIKANCPKCKRMVTREGFQLSCLEWCSYARECVGEEIYQRYFEGKRNLLRDRLLEEISQSFYGFKINIEETNRLIGFAQELLQLFS